MLRRLLVLLTICSPAIADDNSASTDADLIDLSSNMRVSAKPLTRSAPEYPRSELRKGKEAWVEITYCIDESGTPKNISILDSVANEKFEQAAIEAVESWTFEPSLVNGTPTWQSGNTTYVSFALEGEGHFGTRQFRQQFQRLGKLITDGKLDEADELFWEVYNSESLSLYELSKLWAQRVRHEAQGGDMYRVHMALERATASKGVWIEKDSYVQLLHLLVRIEVRLGMFRSALRSYDELVDVAGEKSDKVIELHPLVVEIEDMINNDQILRIAAEVRSKDACSYCNDSWYFSPVRNDFAFANIDGHLSSIDMRCDHKRFESKVSDDVEWHIPESWGSCHVQVYGEPGTMMDVLMLPAQNGG